MLVAKQGQYEINVTIPSDWEKETTDSVMLFFANLDYTVKK